MQAVERHDVIRGVAKGIWRLLRCHPLHEGGFDPVK
jgi:putative component of membrane protein insertase Oxa1/YidC/SpoIIIJ protein YidD